MFKLEYNFLYEKLDLIYDEKLSNEEKIEVMNFYDAIKTYNFIRDFKVAFSKNENVFEMTEEESVVSDGILEKMNTDMLIDMFIALNDDAYFFKPDFVIDGRTGELSGTLDGENNTFDD